MNLNTLLYSTLSLCVRVHADNTHQLCCAAANARRANAFAAFRQWPWPWQRPQWLISADWPHRSLAAHLQAGGPAARANASSCRAATHSQRQSGLSSQEPAVCAVPRTLTREVRNHRRAYMTNLADLLQQKTCLYIYISVLGIKKKLASRNVDYHRLSESPVGARSRAADAPALAAVRCAAPRADGSVDAAHAPVYP